MISQAARRSPFGPEAAVSSVADIAQTSAPTPDGELRPRLLGTAVSAGGAGFVVVELTGGQIQTVRVGERIGELRLRAVAAGVATFEDAGGSRVTLRSALPGSEPRP